MTRPVTRFSVVIENLTKLAAISPRYVAVDADVKVLAKIMKNFDMVSRHFLKV